jgi:hypothetical protein
MINDLRNFGKRLVENTVLGAIERGEGGLCLHAFDRTCIDICGTGF